MTIHIANQGRADATGVHARVAARILTAACAASAFAFILFPVPLFPLAPALSLPEKAQASGVWPLPSPRLSVDLGFLESYEFSGAVYTHRGVDIASDAGARIYSPVDGTVSFAGDVPAGDASVDGTDDTGGGATMRAVSVKMADGRSVTLMPVQDARVQEGESVSAGQELARLAAGGDRSSASPHLHMGLKRDGNYYDPLSLFGLEGTTSAVAAARSEAACSLSDAQAGAQSAGSTEAALAGQGVFAGQGAADTAQGSAGAESIESQSAGSAAGAQGQPASQGAAADEFGTISSGDAASLSETGAAGASPLEAVRSLLSPVFGACGAQLEEMCRALAKSHAAPWLAVAACIAVAAGTVAVARPGRREEKEAEGKRGVFRRRLGCLAAGTRKLCARLRCGLRAACTKCSPKSVLCRALSRRRESSSCERESGVVG